MFRRPHPGCPGVPLRCLQAAVSARPGGILDTFHVTGTVACTFHIHRYGALPQCDFGLVSPPTLTGLDREASKAAFDQFQAGRNLSPRQLVPHQLTFAPGHGPTGAGRR